MADWKVRPYEDGDEIGIVELMNFGSAPGTYTLKHWLWRYKTDPYGFLTVVAEDKGKIVGHMGWWGLSIKIHGKVIKASQASELTVHPDYRRQGMFLSIGKALGKLAKGRGVVFTYGFPNEPAHKGHLQYGWFDVAEIPILTGYYDTYPMLRKPLSFVGNLLFRRLKVKATEVDRVERIDRFPEEVIATTENALAQYDAHVIRNAEYLNWRFFDNPDQRYDVFQSENGYLIMTTKEMSSASRATRRTGFIVDLVACDTQTSSTLLNKAVQEFANKVDSVKCLKQTLTADLLRKNGFLWFPRRRQVLIARINANGLGEFNQKYLDNWFISFGDCDFM